MATLSKEAVQRLALLHTLALWRRGAYGPVRVHKTLFFADEKVPGNRHLFGFRKWRLGQYSDEIAATLNDLQSVGRVETVYDGPSVRIHAKIKPAIKLCIGRFFSDYFKEWHRSLGPAFKRWAYLSNDAIVIQAHDDHSYTTRSHGEEIFSSWEAAAMRFPGLDADIAERLSDFVDVELHDVIRTRMAAAADRKRHAEDWRSIYFDEPKVGKSRKTA